MAYISQDKKKALEPAIKALLKEYGLKGSLRISNHSTLYLTITEGCLDFITDYNATAGKRLKGTRDETYWTPATDHLDANPFHLERSHSGRCLEALDRLTDAMNAGNYDNSDPQTDYFDRGWYAYIQIGKWNKPYTCTAPAASELEAA